MPGSAVDAAAKGVRLDRHGGARRAPISTWCRRCLTCCSAPPCSPRSRSSCSLPCTTRPSSPTPSASPRPPPPRGGGPRTGFCWARRRRERRAAASWEREARRSATPRRDGGLSVLVTGAAGFVGAHCSLALRAREDGVLGLDNFNAYYDPALKRARQRMLASRGVAVLDAALLERLFASVPFTHVLHLAAQAGVRRRPTCPPTWPASSRSSRPRRGTPTRSQPSCGPPPRPCTGSTPPRPSPRSTARTARPCSTPRRRRPGRPLRARTTTSTASSSPRTGRGAVKQQNN
jgi:UDP-glucuronate 4-epimerase